MDEKPGFDPRIALCAGILAVSTGAIFARMADAPSLVIAAYRVGLAALVVLPVALVKNSRELRLLSGTDWLYSFFSGVFLALHFATWISSLAYTSVASSVVLVNTSPLWVAVFMPFLTKEKASRSTLIGIGLSIFGAVIIGSGDFYSGKDVFLGDMLALAGAITLGIYLLMGKKVRPKLSLLSYIAICYGSAALTLWSAVLLTGLPVSDYSNTTWSAFFAMALIPQLIGHSAYNWSLRWFSTPLVSVSLLGEPVCSSLMALVLFGERLQWNVLIGGCLVLSGIYVASRGDV